MATVLITGGTGLIGKALRGLLLQRGYDVVVLTRDADKQRATDPRLSFANWDVDKQTIDSSAIERADYVIHLAGAGVADKRWSDKRKKEIVDSRINSSALLIKALSTNANHVKAVACASGIGWYGPDAAIPNPHRFRETDPVAHDFLGETCQRWEASIDPVTSLGKKLVKLRTGIVLSTEGGALKEFMNPLRFGIAAILGNGKQIISWIHIDDICRMYLQAIEDPKMEGVYNAVTPNYLSNKTFTLLLAKAMKHNFYIPLHVPSPLLKIGLGEMSTEVLKSATVSADKIRSAGFSFLYPTLDAAFNQLFSHGHKPGQG